MPRLVLAVITAAAAVALAAATLVVLDGTPAEAGPQRQVRLYQAARDLTVARETRRGYQREKFEHWVDADGDCRDTRDEVLATESTVAVRGCDVRRGRWRSRYDGIVVRDASELDVDHVVALAEAWDSGARRWRLGTRRAFANDLADPRSLIAVTAASNRSKSDDDPAEWLPARGRCAFLRDWVVVKSRWSLSVDRRERRALLRETSGCRNRVVRYRVAQVRLR